MPMTLVSTVSLSTSASSISFTGIPQTGKDLLLIFSLRDTTAANLADITININGSTGSRRTLFGTGASITQSISTSNFPYGQMPATSSTAGTLGNGKLYISNYTSSFKKIMSLDVVTENNATTSHQTIAAADTTTTSAITTLQIAGWTALAQYSLASLYIIS